MAVLMLVKDVGEKWLFLCWWRMLVKNGCWWKTCMLVKNFHRHSPPKFHDVSENNVGEIVCWRKKICSFKIICMLVNYVGENFDVCWWKVFLLKKYVCWWKMLVKLFHWNVHVDQNFFCMLVKSFRLYSKNSSSNSAWIQIAQLLLLSP